MEARLNQAKTGQEKKSSKKGRNPNNSRNNFRQKCPAQNRIKFLNLNPMHKT